MKARHYILIGILLLGLGLRLVRISWPNEPVFDERHFATYAADYLNDKIFYDIHPPLGKIIYSGALYAADGFKPFTGPADFVKFNLVGQEASSTASSSLPFVEATGIPYGSYPYVPLRATDAVFGTVLVLAFYWFLRSAGMGETGALLGAFFAAVDNALVLQTRLILMDGMYLAFGFAALALWFRRRSAPVAAGAAFALSLGVKLIGIVFLAPIAADHAFRYANAADAERGSAKRRLARFAAAAAIVFAVVALLNFAYFSPTRIISFGEAIGIKIPAVSSPPIRLAIAAAMTTIVPWTGYVQGGTGPDASQWYAWPVMLGPMYYYAPNAGPGGHIVFFGDPALWFGSTLAMVFLIALLARHWRKLATDKEWAVPLVLLSGYTGSLLPFFTVVHRQTFMYHYLPGLMFAFGILAWMLSRWLKFGDVAALTRMQWFVLSMIVIVAGVGFLSVAPFTYGL